VRISFTVLLLVSACAGNVVIEPGGSGGPAEGGSSSTTTGTVGATGSSTGTGSPDGVRCSNLSGLALANGGCEADATCNDKPVLVDCEPSNEGATCSCEVAGHAVGTCQDDLQSPTICSPSAGCCAAYFGGG
jgi:hypothetical protein